MVSFGQKEESTESFFRLQATKNWKTGGRWFNYNPAYIKQDKQHIWRRVQQWRESWLFFEFQVLTVPPHRDKAIPISFLQGWQTIVWIYDPIYCINSNMFPIERHSIAPFELVSPSETCFQRPLYRSPGRDLELEHLIWMFEDQRQLEAVPEQRHATAIYAISWGTEVEVGWGWIDVQ